MWEIYVEPNLKAQAEINNVSTSQFADVVEPVGIDQKIAEAQAAGMMFGADPLEVGKAIRKTWPPTKSDFDAIRAKLAERDANGKAK